MAMTVTIDGATPSHRARTRNKIGIRKSVMDFDPEMEKRLKQAEAAVTNLKPEFAKSVTQDLKLIDEILARLTADKSDNKALDRLRAIAHELKGNAGSFGFPLASAIAKCFYDLLLTLDIPNAQIITLLRNHRNVLEIAIKPTISKKAKSELEEFIVLSRKLTAAL
jgi:chemotaxis protein histidine kinase CheA